MCEIRENGVRAYRIEMQCDVRTTKCMALNVHYSQATNNRLDNFWINSAHRDRQSTSPLHSPLPPLRDQLPNTLLRAINQSMEFVKRPLQSWTVALEQPQNSPVSPPEQKSISPFSRMP